MHQVTEFYVKAFNNDLISSGNTPSEAMDVVVKDLGRDSLGEYG